MKYFITGATGFIGGHLARQLREAGHEVIAVVRNPAKAQELAELGVTIRQGDVTDKESIITDAPLSLASKPSHITSSPWQISPVPSPKHTKQKLPLTKPSFSTDLNPCS